MSAGNIFSFASGKRRVVNHEFNGKCRWVYFDGGEGFGVRIVGNCFANIDIGNSSDGDDVAGLYFIYFNAIHALEAE